MGDPGSMSSRQTGGPGPMTGAGRPRISGFIFLALLLGMVIAEPALESHRYGPVIQATTYTGALLAGLWVIGRSRKMLATMGALIAPALAARWINHFWPGVLPHAVVAALVMAPVGYMIAVLFGFILRARRVDASVLCAAISNFLMIGVLWAFAYQLVDALVPGSFSLMGTASGAVLPSFTPFYFSIVTMCTVGYGDITPVSPVARMLALLEAMTGTFYMAILIARLVAMHSSVPAEE